MQKKIIIAGIISGVVISGFEYLIFGILMKPVFTEYAAKGLMEIEGKPFGAIHYGLQILLGFPVVYFYSIASKSFKRSPGSIIFIGLLAGVFCLSITTALYTFYNLGTIIPVVISIDKLIECILCCFIASLFIKN